MRNFLDAINSTPHAEERPKGASRSTHDVEADPRSPSPATPSHAPPPRRRGVTRRVFERQWLPLRPPLESARRQTEPGGFDRRAAVHDDLEAVGLRSGRPRHRAPLIAPTSDSAPFRAIWLLFVTLYDNLQKLFKNYGK